jgi:hypothetical protein
VTTWNVTSVRHRPLLVVWCQCQSVPPRIGPNRNFLLQADQPWTKLVACSIIQTQKGMSQNSNFHTTTKSKQEIEDYKLWRHEENIRKDLEFVELISSTLQGAVYKGLRKPSGELVAVKIASKKLVCKHISRQGLLVSENTSRRIDSEAVTRHQRSGPVC